MSHHTRFPRVGRWRRGYRPRQVEHFLDRVETALTGQGIVAEVSAAEVRRVGFDLVRHGYDPRDVDAALEQLELRVLEHEAKPVGRRGTVDPFREAAFLSQELGHPYRHRFPRAARLRRGYDVDDVDDFTDRVLATLQGSERLTHDEVRSAVFARRRHGYDEDAVDELLDRVIEFLLQPGTSDVLPPEPGPDPGTGRSTGTGTGTGTGTAEPSASDDSFGGGWRAEPSALAPPRPPAETDPGSSSAPGS